MLKDYVLGSEIAKFGDIHIANISMMISNGKNLFENHDYIKAGGVTLINKNSPNIPLYIYKIIQENKDKFTNLDGLIPYPTFKEELSGFTSKIKDKYNIINIEGKKFVKILDPVLENIILNEDVTRYVVHSDEVHGLKQDKLIQGEYPLNKYKTLVWY